MSVSAAIQADDGKAEPLVRAHDLCIALGGRPDGQTCASHCERVEKFTSSNHVAPWSNCEPCVLRGLSLRPLRLSAFSRMQHKAFNRKERKGRRKGRKEI